MEHPRRTVSGLFCVLAVFLVTGVEAGDAEDEGCVSEAEQVEGRLRLGVLGPHVTTQAVEVPGQEEEAHVAPGPGVRLPAQTEAHTALHTEWT